MWRPIVLVLCSCAVGSAFAQTTQVIPMKWADAGVMAAQLSGDQGKPTDDQIHQSRQDWVNGFAEHVLQQVKRLRPNQEPGWYFASQIVTSPYEQVLGGGDTTRKSLLPEGIEPPLVVVMPQNAIMAKGTPAAIDQLKELVAMLDVKPQMVNVEVRLEDTPRTTTNEWGMDYATQAGNLLLQSRGNTPTSGLQVHTRIGRTDVTAGRNQSTDSGATLTGANVTTTNNYPALITTGRMLPIFETQVTYDDFGHRHVDTTVDSIFVGTELFVQPRINRDGTVTMLLDVSFIDAVGSVTGPNGLSLPITDTVATQTQVTVPDGETLQIGGFERGLDDLNTRYKGFLMDRSTKVDSHPALFVTPRIIRDTPAG